MFFHMFLLFQLLLSYSSIFTKLLLTNFFAPFLAARESDFLSWFFCTFGTLSLYVVHAPPYFWHRMRGFLKARRSQEPGSSLTTGEFSPFRLLPMVSGANVHWANANYTFLTHKNPQTDTFLREISPAKLRSTTWVWNPGIPKGFPNS